MQLLLRGILSRFFDKWLVKAKNIFSEIILRNFQWMQTNCESFIGPFQWTILNQSSWRPSSHEEAKTSQLLASLTTTQYSGKFYARPQGTSLVRQKKAFLSSKSCEIYDDDLNQDKNNGHRFTGSCKKDSRRSLGGCWPGRPTEEPRGSWTCSSH